MNKKVWRPKLIKICLAWIVACLVINLPGFAETGDPQHGAQLAETCAACHGKDGTHPLMPAYPKIAGLQEGYLIKQLQNFKAGAQGNRTSPLSAQMYAIVAQLSDQDIADLAAYFSAQKPTSGEADAKYVQEGEQLYRGGKLKGKVPSCAACHGPTGAGNAEAKYPRLSGQSTNYMIDQLKYFKDGSRKADLMTSIAANLTENDMKAVSNFASGLH